MQVKNLPKNPPYGVMLFCRICQAENSCREGDYFTFPPNHELECCDVSMELVRKSTVYKPWEEKP